MFIKHLKSKLFHYFDISDKIIQHGNGKQSKLLSINEENVQFNLIIKSEKKRVITSASILLSLSPTMKSKRGFAFPTNMIL